MIGATKALGLPGLVFGTKILPQYSIENVFLIFLLVSLAQNIYLFAINLQLTLHRKVQFAIQRYVGEKI